MHLSAQQNEAGVFSEPAALSLSGGPVGQYAFSGVQFMHSFSRHYAYRLSAGYARVSIADEATYNGAATVDFSELWTRVSMPMACGGPVYTGRIKKRFEWHTGIDLRLGYAAGFRLHTHIVYDTLTWSNFLPNTIIPHSADSATTTHQRLLLTGCSPFGGASWHWRCCKIGCETSIVFLNATLLYPGSHYNVASFSGFYTRLYIDYCF